MPAGHCGDKNVKHDPSGDIVHCNCYDKLEKYFVNRDTAWIDDIIKRGCERLSTYSYAESGHDNDEWTVYFGETKNEINWFGEGLLRQKWNKEASECRDKSAADWSRWSQQECVDNFKTVLNTGKWYVTSPVR